MLSVQNRTKVQEVVSKIRKLVVWILGRSKEEAAEQKELGPEKIIRIIIIIIILIFIIIVIIIII